MKIKYISYIYHGHLYSVDGRQFVDLENYVLKTLITKIKKIKFAHIGWVGIKEDDFMETIVTKAVIFYDGDWDGKLVVDTLMSDNEVPWLMYEEFPAPFFNDFERIGHDREKIIKILEGGEIDA